jgi:hypothetical protein
MRNTVHETFSPMIETLLESVSRFVDTSSNARLNPVVGK